MLRRPVSVINRQRFRSLLVIGLLSLFPWPAYPADSASSRGSVVFLPPGDLYAPYIADPHRVGFGVQWQNFTNTQIPDSGSHRVALRAGGRFGIIRVDSSGTGSAGWQMNVEGGFNAEFDADHSLDNIGWDGRYGLVVTTARSDTLALKFGLLHDSSHVGDEYMERTGRTRIGYTRHELTAGVSRTIGEHWRTYAEAGWGYQFGNDALMKPGRGQTGLEYESCQGPRENCAGWYGALDLSSMEERNWRLDTALQAGFVARKDERTWRIGIEWYHGRPPVGEFFQYTESSISLGIWLDV